MSMRIRTASDRALLVEAADLDEAMRLHLAWAGLPGVVERVLGARTVLVRFDPAIVSTAELSRTLAETMTDAGELPALGEVTIPVHYDGADLDEVAALLGMTPDEVVRRHLAADWRVAFAGFAPGFAYIVGSDPLLSVPRRATPRTRVPAGAVGLAGEFTGVYPRESPGGWQLIGTTDAVMWDVSRTPPALLAPGTRVRFERVLAPRDPALSDAVGTASRSLSAERQHRDETPATAIEVLAVPLQLLIQDRGRPGFASLGVPASGAADRTALRDANRAVGNPADAAALECVGGVTLRFRGPGVAVVTGAESPLLLTDASGDERPIAHGVPLATADGYELTVGPATRGLRSMVGVRGGILAPAVLGSRSADTLSGLGPAPVMAGDVLEVGAAPRHPVEPDPLPRALPAPGDLVELAITLGPRDDWFTAGAVQALVRQEWRVTPRADRIGIRLQSTVPLERAIAGELPSEGAVAGAIQVPPDGQPVLFLADHPVTGGYPIIAAVTDRCLDLAAQLPPGARVRFVVR